MLYEDIVLVDTKKKLDDFWEEVREEVSKTPPDISVMKAQELPLARIKKIMKLDEDVKHMMISAEAPVLLAKAAEIFVRELTLRAWLHTIRCRRRTLQRIDISMAIYDGETDQFDFLIDIVPREEVRQSRRQQQSTPQTPGGQPTGALMNVNIDGGGQVLQTADGSNIQVFHYPALDANAGGVVQGGVSEAVLNSQTVTYLPTSGNGTSVSGDGGVTYIQAPAAVSVAPVAVQSQPGPAIVSNPQVVQGVQASINSNGAQQQQQTIQYVLQLPSNIGMAGTPIQIQLLQSPAGPILTAGDGSQPSNIVPAGPQHQQPPQILQLVTLPAAGQQINLGGAPTAVQQSQGYTVNSPTIVGNNAALVNNNNVVWTCANVVNQPAVSQIIYSTEDATQMLLSSTSTNAGSTMLMPVAGSAGSVVVSNNNPNLNHDNVEVPLSEAPEPPSVSIEESNITMKPKKEPVRDV